MLETKKCFVNVKGAGAHSVDTAHVGEGRNGIATHHVKGRAEGAFRCERGLQEQRRGRR